MYAQETAADNMQYRAKGPYLSYQHQTFNFGATSSPSSGGHAPLHHHQTASADSSAEQQSIRSPPSNRANSGIFDASPSSIRCFAAVTNFVVCLVYLILLLIRLSTPYVTDVEATTTTARRWPQTIDVTRTRVNSVVSPALTKAGDPYIFNESIWGDETPSLHVTRVLLDGWEGVAQNLSCFTPTLHDTVAILSSDATATATTVVRVPIQSPLCHCAFRAFVRHLNYSTNGISWDENVSELILDHQEVFYVPQLAGCALSNVPTVSTTLLGIRINPLLGLAFVLCASTISSACFLPSFQSTTNREQDSSIIQWIAAVVVLILLITCCAKTGSSCVLQIIIFILLFVVSLSLFIIDSSNESSEESILDPSPSCVNSKRTPPRVPMSSPQDTKLGVVSANTTLDGGESVFWAGYLVQITMLCLVSDAMSDRRDAWVMGSGMVAMLSISNLASALSKSNSLYRLIPGDPSATDKKKHCPEGTCPCPSCAFVVPTPQTDMRVLRVLSCVSRRCKGLCFSSSFAIWGVIQSKMAMRYFVDACGAGLGKDEQFWVEFGLFGYMVVPLSDLPFPQIPSSWTLLSMDTISSQQTTGSVDAAARTARRMLAVAVIHVIITVSFTRSLLWV